MNVDIYQNIFQYCDLFGLNEIKTISKELRNEVEIFISLLKNNNKNKKINKDHKFMNIDFYIFSKNILDLIGNDYLNNSIFKCIHFSSTLEKDKRIKYFKTLLLADANINFQDEKGDTSLYYVFFYNFQEVFEFLLINGADPNIQNKIGNTTLFCCRENKNFIKLLIKYGANVNIQNKFGYTPLMLACSNNYIEEIKILLTNGANPNIENIFENTALIMYCRYKTNKDKYRYREKTTAEKIAAQLAAEENIIELLINAGANINHKNDFGESAAQILNSK